MRREVGRTLYPEPRGRARRIGSWSGRALWDRETASRQSDPTASVSRERRCVRLTASRRRCGRTNAPRGAATSTTSPSNASELRVKTPLFVRPRSFISLLFAVAARRVSGR
ncbi:hypothetical protein AAFF_G00310620 [Aldrovandia affinis]|uniref:Uncharacterized protein n=1 Tax=Aldrovandia affinis TaxID=143900 RepID=A0AAD7R7N3_9TELE|nr:hypothetical protein AAFF_G00310620 [Aldrovandia affinis]